MIPSQEQVRPSLQKVAVCTIWHAYPPRTYYGAASARLEAQSIRADARESAREVQALSTKSRGLGSIGIFFPDPCVSRGGYTGYTVEQADSYARQLGEKARERGEKVHKELQEAKLASVSIRAGAVSASSKIEAHGKAKRCAIDCGLATSTALQISKKGPEAFLKMVSWVNPPRSKPSARASI
jgi:hypothetical protein